MASFAIDGTLSEESVLEEIRERYAQLVVDGEIDDELPSGVEEPHRSSLTVHVDGEELVYERDAAPNDDAAARHFLLAGQESAYWSDALGT